MKKYFLPIFLFILLAGISINSADFKWISSNYGLKLRSTPDLSSETLSIIPYNSQVTILDKSKDKTTIDAVTDFWYKIFWNNQRGWVFGGYLSDKPSAEINNISNFEILLDKKQYQNIENKIINYIRSKNDKMDNHDEQFTIELKDKKILILVDVNFLRITDTDYKITEGYEMATWETNYMDKMNQYIKASINQKNFSSLGNYKVSIFDSYDISSASVVRNYELFINKIYISAFLSFQSLADNNFVGVTLTRNKNNAVEGDKIQVKYKNESIKYICGFENYFKNILDAVSKNIK